MWYEAKDERWYRALNGDRIQFMKGVRCNVTMDGTEFEPSVLLAIQNSSSPLKTHKTVQKVR